MSTFKPTPATYAELFEIDKRGAAILEDLMARFAATAKLPDQQTPGIDAVLMTYHRMGAQAVLQHIVRQINLAHGVAETEDEDEPQA